MSFVLMVVGILAIALGAILIGFGIPINEFSLGNTLILAGTMTSAAGLVTFAISRAVSQLARIADLMASRPMAAPAAPATVAAPMAPSITPPPSPRAPQPRAQQNEEFDVPEAVEPPRNTPRGPIPTAEELAAPPAAPAAPARGGWRPPRPSAERPPAKPVEPRRPPAVESTPPARREPAVEAPADAASSGRGEAATVLKSGIVDGMAYTLYTDGSIEAELAQGVVRFGSIEELRNHLEKGG
ncbi:hypothetical protein [Pseudorhodoplanes sp.]|uniref:hypothetical protein n=1 Tax=Pseudorhodoplanes sp. TaxID=1934341 RepID=UPI002CE33E5A|nr:hypothetical protein [Pseudorhodoplanes sp.]HWV51207.1 hypothetical protein [Pseudorhodoplanes sp.]